MRPATPKQQKLFAYLKKQKGHPFQLQPLVAATGYGEASAERSLSEHWASIVERWGHGAPKQWRTRAEFQDMEIAEFQKAISQSKRHPGRLKEPRARELAALVAAQTHLSLEVFNRPSLTSRIEAFLLLFTNAWELLLKCETIEGQGWDAIFESRAPTSGKHPRSRRFEDLVSALPSDTPAQEALKAQLTDLYELRNQAAHLLIARPSREMVHLFAGSLRSLSLRYELLVGTPLFSVADVAGYLVLVGFADASRDVVAVAASGEFDQRIAAQLEKYGESYGIPLRIALRAVDDDLASSAQLAEGEVLTSSTSAVRETYRFKRDEVARRVTRALASSGSQVQVTPQCVDIVRRSKQWGTKSENPFVTEFPAAKLYSDAAVQAIADLLLEDSGYVDKAKRRELRNRRKRGSKKKGTKKA